MSKIDEYRQELKTLADLKPFLLMNSGLPGPRGNLELAAAVAEIASKQQVEEFLSISMERAPENTPEVFLVFCGVVSLGSMMARGGSTDFKRLRSYASDPRWRIREATAIALQTIGERDMNILLKEMKKWIKGSWYEKRAAAAALAEPRLLKEGQIVHQVLKIFDDITSDIEAAEADHMDDGFKILRQAMGYCWSVSVAALPEMGKPAMEKWLRSRSKDVRWIMKENLKKNRLLRMDAKWVAACNARLEKLK